MLFRSQSRCHDATLSATLTGVAVLEATQLQLRHIPNPSPHILLTYAAEVLAGTTAPPEGCEPVPHLASLLHELRPHLGESLWPMLLERLPAAVGQLACAMAPHDSTDPEPAG